MDERDLVPLAAVLDDVVAREERTQMTHYAFRIKVIEEELRRIERGIAFFVHAFEVEDRALLVEVQQA